MATAAGRALYLADDKVDEATAERLTVEQVTARNEAVSVFMAMAIGACCSHERVMEAARALSALSKRRALLVPLMVGAAKRRATLVQEVARLLPADREATVLAAFTDGPKLAQEALDDLGDVRIVGKILRRVGFLFVPKSK
jgi:hypothetical protein